MKKLALFLVLGVAFAQVHAQAPATKGATTTKPATTTTTTTTTKSTTTPAAKKADTTPAAVTAAFAKAYPDVKDAKWSKEGANYVATFTDATSKMATMVSYNAAGALQHVKAQIDPTSLPATATDYLKKNYATQTVSKAIKATDAKNVVSYEAHLKDGSKVYFDETGKFTKVDKPAAKKEETKTPATKPADTKPAPAKTAPKTTTTTTTTTTPKN